MNATYLIEGKAFQLVDGRCEHPAAPGSAMKTVTTVIDQPVYGDIDRDGDEDVLLLLTHDSGGSGTFYYVAAAIREGDRYKGTDTVFLGDRIVPNGIGIEQGVVTIRYTGRRARDPMSAKASVSFLTVLTWQGDGLQPVIMEGQGQVIYGGYAIIGHEVRSFQPCNQEETLWLMGEPDAMSELRRAYTRAATGGNPYQPVFMFLTGKWVGRPESGFGADYPAAFQVRELIKAIPDSECSQPDAGEGMTAKQHLKITFDLDRLDRAGLVGDAGAKRAITYEFCIPLGQRFREEVTGIDPTASLAAGAPGRIGCGRLEYLCTGSTHQTDFLRTIELLANLPYVQRIDGADFE